VPDALDRPYQRRSADSAMAGDDGADCNHVIGVAGMTHPEYEPQSDYGE
jgi:hypothetical protein